LVGISAVIRRSSFIPERTGIYSAAKAMGAKPLYIILRHVLPKLPVISLFLLR
jgi:ABC-type dipeptide/oligopeptide/nickel transport system permease subunit